MPRRNPLTKLAAQAFRDQDPLYLNEMRKAKERFDFEAAAIALAEWEGKGHEEMRAHGLRVIADYVRAGFDDASEALGWLARMNRKLAVWCACEVARTVLKYVPAEEIRPLRAIDTASSWVFGEVSRRQVRIAAEAAASAAEAAVDSAEAGWTAYYSSYAEATASDSASCAAYIATNSNYEAIARLSVSSAADANLNASMGPGSRKRVNNEQSLRDLVSVVADAIITFPQRRKRTR